jgi:serine/threonine-protein kinase
VIAIATVAGIAAFAGLRAPAPVAAARLGLGKAALLASLHAQPIPEATAAPAPSAPPPSAAPPPAKKAPPVAAHVRSSCDPPYTVDASGIRRVKRECL